MEVEIHAQFPLGKIVIKPEALEALNKADQQPEVFLGRHALCDWGDLSEEEQERNERALANNKDLFSRYLTNAQESLWVITRADRSSTTITKDGSY